MKWTNNDAKKVQPQRRASKQARANEIWFCLGLGLLLAEYVCEANH